MKKILFNNRYGLETAVIERRKTMTRRIVRCPKTFRGVSDVELEFHRRLGSDIWYDCVVTDGDGRKLGQLQLPYELGEVVAVGQRYKDVPMDFLLSHLDDPRKRYFEQQLIQQSAGWRNKMFTLPEKMPWQVQMTDLWFEHMQDISDEDCLREGLLIGEQEPRMYGFRLPKGTVLSFLTPREAFAALIDRINGHGTWKYNPWVVAYTMDLQRAEGFKEQETNK